MIESIQDSDIMGLPWLVLAKIVNDHAVFTHPLEIQRGVGWVGVVESQDSVVYVVEQGVKNLYSIPVERSQNVLIREDKQALVLESILPYLVQIQMLPELREIHQHDPGVDIGNIFFNFQTEFIKLLQKISTQNRSSVKNETYFRERKSFCFSAGSNQLSPNMIPKALLGTLLKQKQ